MIELLHIDCMTFMRGLPDNAFDIAITSPPYNQIAHSPGGGFLKGSITNEKLSSGYASHSDDMPELDYQAWMNEVLTELLRVCKGLVWMNHKIRYRKKQGIHPLHFFKHDFHSEIIWNRKGSLTVNALRYAPSHEHLYGFGMPHYWHRCNDMLGTVWDIVAVPQGLDHPCPFLSIIPERVIQSSCPPGGIVFDPFAGTGTTGIAAIDTGRSFVGCELDAGYADAARKRLTEHQAQPRLFAPEVATATQLTIDQPDKAA